MGSSALYIVQSELNAVVMRLRRTQRLQGSVFDSKDPLLRSFLDLRDVLNSVAELTDVAPIVFVSPFLDVIRSEQTCGSATGQALIAVEKFISYNMFDPHCFTTTSAVQQVAEAVTHARFVGTDPSDDEVVLLRILQVLRALLLSKSGCLLTDETLCEVLQSCFRICLENRLTLLLRKTAESCLCDMVSVIFARLASFSEDSKHPYVRRWMNRPVGAGREERRYRRVKKWNYGLQQTSTLTTAELERSSSPEKPKTTSLHSDIAQMPVERSQGIALFDCAKEAPSAEQILLPLNQEVHGPKEVERSVPPLPTSDDVNEALEASDTPEQKESACEQSDPNCSVPYGVPCVRELLRFLIALCNPWEKQNSETVVDLGLSLLNVAFEVGVEQIGKFSLILPLVQNELCRNLISLLHTAKVSIISSVLRLGFLLFESLRHHLKFQLEMYMSRLMELATTGGEANVPVINGGGGPTMKSGIVSPGVRTELRELVLEALVAMWRIPGFVTELYLNYDCDLYCSNLFEELTKLLSKNAFPVTTLTAAQLLSLDALLTVVDTIEMNCHMRIINFHNNSPRALQCTTVDQMAGDRHVSKLLHQRMYGANSCSSTPPPLPNHEDLLALKTKKRLLTAGSELFNQNPNKGIAYLQEHEILETPYVLTSLVHWLRDNPRLNKRKIAEFIVNRKNTKILEAFVQSFDFKNVRLDDALRQFLESFRLPGEAAEISMVIEFFSEHWFQCNERPFASADAAFTLSYAIIMLNVDQHNPTAKKQQQPMTLEDFVKNLNGVNGGENFDQSMLEKIYYSVRNEEIVMPEEQSGLVRESYLWDMLLQRGWSEQGQFVHAASGNYDHDLFCLVWGPTVAALSFVFDKAVDQDSVVGRIIGGFRKSAAIAAHYFMCDVFDNLIISLCKFSQLLNLDISGESNEHFCNQFVHSVKAQIAAKTMFQLVHSHGDILREGWKNIIDCLLRCYHGQLLPDCMLVVEDFVDPSGRISIARRVQKPTKTDSGIFTSIYNYLGGGGSSSVEARDARPGFEGADSIKAARAIVAECHPELIVSDSKYLSGEAFGELIKALLTISASILADIRHGAGLTDQTEASLIFHTELLVAVALENRDRVEPFWRTLITHLFSLISDFPEKQFLMERATVAMLRLVVRLLVREELKDEIFSSLRMLQTIKPASLLIMARQIAYGLHEIVRNNAVYVKSTGHWAVLFNLLETVGAAAFPEDLEQYFRSIPPDEGIHSDEDGVCNDTPAADDRGCTSDSELYQVNKKQSSLAAAANENITLGQRATSGDWLLVVGGSEAEERNKCALDSGKLKRSWRKFSANRLLLRTRLRSHDSQAYVKCCETLAFLIRDMAYVTRENFDSCVQCLRAFIEAGLNGGLHYMNQGANVNLSKSRNRDSNRSRSDAAAEAPETSNVASTYLQLSLQLLDLTYFLFFQAAAIFKDEPCPSTVDIWSRIWQPLLQALARLCFDQRRLVRSTAMTLLQRSLLVPDLRRVSGCDWEKCFNNVFFPLLRTMLESGTKGKTTANGADEIRVRALTMTSKVFLQHLMPLSALPSFTELWLDILGFMQEYLLLESNDIAESVPESIKNMLLVMETAGLFNAIPDLLERTRHQLTGPLSSLMDTLIQQQHGASVPPTQDEAAKENNHTLEEVVVINTTLQQEQYAATPVVLLTHEPHSPSSGNIALLSPLQSGLVDGANPVRTS